MYNLFSPSCWIPWSTTIQVYLLHDLPLYRYLLPHLVKSLLHTIPHFSVPLLLRPTIVSVLLNELPLDNSFCPSVVSFPCPLLS